MCVSSISICAAASSVDGADHTLPAINVKFDFPSASTLELAKEQVNSANRGSMFERRVLHLQSKTEIMSTMMEGFAKEAHGQLDAILSIVQPSSRRLAPDREQPYFLQKAERDRSVAGITMSDVEALAEDAESVSKIYLAAAQSRPTSKEEQQSVLEGNVKALGAINAELMHEKHETDVAGSVTHCAACERDHDQMCPDGWSEVAAGYCSGPSAYDGPCIAFGQFSGLPVSAKIDFERACLVCWPCRSPA